MQWETKQNEKSALNPKRDCDCIIFLWRLPWIITRAVCRSLYIVSSCLWVGWGGVFTSGKRDWPRLLKRLVSKRSCETACKRSYLQKTVSAVAARSENLKKINPQGWQKAMHVGRVCQTGLVKSSWQTFLPEAVYLDTFLLTLFHLLRILSMERKRGISYLMD